MMGPPNLVPSVLSAFRPLTIGRQRLGASKMSFQRSVRKSTGLVLHQKLHGITGILQKLTGLREFKTSVRLLFDFMSIICVSISHQIWYLGRFVDKKGGIIS